jgi:hypothetical protein
VSVRSARRTIHAVSGALDSRAHRRQTERTMAGCVLLASLSQFATARRT